MIERVQKRALRILFPALSYKDAIVAANSTRLNVRRDELCKKVWDGICVPFSLLKENERKSIEVSVIVFL